MAEFHQLQELCEQVVVVSEQLCAARPVETTFYLQEKNAEAIQREVERGLSGVLRIVFQDRRKTGGLDLEALEMAMRTAMHQAGAAAMSQLLRYEPPTPCSTRSRYPTAQYLTTNCISVPRCSPPQFSDHCFGPGRCGPRLMQSEDQSAGH